MKNLISIKRCMFILITFLNTFHEINSFEYSCPKVAPPDLKIPVLPNSYSANIRINYLYDLYSVEMKYATNREEKKELIEFKRQGRHVQYITRGDQKSTLFIQYKEDEHPTCKVTKTTEIRNFLEEEDAGKDQIILKAAEIMMFPHEFDLFPLPGSDETGVIASRFEGCLTEPRINISILFASEDWSHTHVSALTKGLKYPEKVVASVGRVSITALYSYFDPTVPDNSVFQPPSDVYCKGFREDKKPPQLPNYFSYIAEIIVYESSAGIAPIVSQRKVFYDYPAGIARVDFNDPLAKTPDMFSEVTAKEKSIIHDFNSGVQYIFDPFTGKCSIDTFQATFDAISFQVRQDNKMLKGIEYFWLNETNISYNGQYPIRGMTADVYTARRVDPATNKATIISWYFSTKETRIAEKDNIEKNVLLRMYVRPETAMDKQGVTEVNFYNFDSEEPSIFTYDLTSCFNDSSSKILVFTFPGIDALKGSGKFIGKLIHSAIVEATGVRKQRIYLREVIFSGGYMYAEFSLLEESPVKRNVSLEIPIDAALKKLEASVSVGNFTVTATFGNETFLLKPEPNGLNIFAGDRVRIPTEAGYKEGSVISLTIGMLILGFVLGGVALNLVMHRKFGVSLFQKSKYGNGFGNPLNESSM